MYATQSMIARTTPSSAYTWYKPQHLPCADCHVPGISVDVNVEHFGIARLTSWAAVGTLLNIIQKRNRRKGVIDAAGATLHGIKAVVHARRTTWQHVFVGLGEFHQRNARATFL